MAMVRSMVGRPREFDTDEVLDAAMRAFWDKGYESTSLCDLMQATGLHKGSLYQAFGDKHSLFLQSLQRYLAEMRRQKTAILKSAATPLEGFINVAHGMVDMAIGDSDCPAGCMAINSLVELAPHDAAVQDMLADHLQAMRKSMVETITAAQKNGQISTARPAELISNIVLTFMAGIGAHLKGAMTGAEAHDLLDAQIQALT